MLRTLTDQCFELQKIISPKLKRVWDDIGEDYSFDNTKFQYFYKDGIITKKDMPPDESDKE